LIFNTNTWRRINYTVMAPVYDAVAVRLFQRRRRRSLEALNLQPGERVLIVGAGTGLDLPLIGRGPVITAIDLTPVMIARLKRRAAAFGLDVDARVMDGQALEFADATFDAVILHLILSLIPDPKRCMREVARVLRPGGRAVILDKFVPDAGKPPLGLRVINPIARVLATELTRRLGPIMEGSGLQCVHSEAVGFGGLLKVVLARK